MIEAKMSGAKIVERAEAIYRERIAANVEPQRNGDYVIIDVDSGAYEIDGDEVRATKRA